MAKVEQLRPGPPGHPQARGAPEAGAPPSATYALSPLDQPTRASSAPELAAAFGRELAEQRVLFDGMNLVDLAHTVELMEEGVIPLEAGAALLAALLDLVRGSADFKADPALGDLYVNRQAWLNSRTSAAGWLGAGRARRECTTTAYHLIVRARLLTLAQALLDACGALLERAASYRDALMTDYTYLQPAQPTTFGHYLVGFAYPLLRDLDRVRALFGRTNLSPAGCGATSGSTVLRDRERLASLLGFDGLVTHARDAMWQADLPIETVAVATAACISQSRLAEDLQVFATTEFGLVDLDQAHSRTSAVMPQKKNPYALAYVRGIANQLIGMLASTASSARTPTGQVDNRLFVYGNVPWALEAAAEAIALMAGVVERLRLNSARANSSLESGFTTATDLAEAIMGKGRLDFARAHMVVSRLARNLAARGLGARDTTLHDVEQAARDVGAPEIGLSEQALKRALDARAAIASRVATGGAASAALERMVDECRARLDQHAVWRSRTASNLHAAEQRLLKHAGERSRTQPCPST
jgi:argininosuccinate lyase